MPERQERINDANDADALRTRIAELERQLVEREAIVRRREDELTRAMTESVTGLRRREWLYQTLHDEVRSALAAAGCGDTEAADMSSVRAALAGCDGERLRAADVSVLIADIAYLSLVNLSGHAEGDALLRRIGDAARSVGSPPVSLPDREAPTPPVVFCRTGGDEFGALLHGVPDTVRSVASRFQSEVAEADIPALTQRGLQPHIDMGLAGLREGVEALRLLAEGGIEVPQDNRIGKIVDYIMAIADRRAILQKGVDRIRLLLTLRRDKPERYQEVISSLRKGAYGIEDSALDLLIADQDRGVDIEPSIRSFVVTATDRLFDLEQERRTGEHQIIKAIADRA